MMATAQTARPGKFERRTRPRRAEDEELVARISEGSYPALEVLYDRYDGLLYSLALRILGDSTAAEEVVQDTFVTVWRKAVSFDPQRGRAHSWLLKIARNRAIDELRRRKRRCSRLRPLLEDVTPDTVDDTGESDAVWSWDLCRGSTLAAAIENLPETQREVLDLSYFQGLSQLEISALTGVPLGTVKTRKRLALGKLRAALVLEA